MFATPPSSPDHKGEDGEELHISMHAISGTVLGASTFTLRVKLGRIHVVALVDSGSTSTFMTPATAVKSQCKITNHDPIRVAVANGNILVSSQ